MYIINNYPFEETKRNLNEIFNEAFYLAIVYSIIPFSDAYDMNYDLKYACGFVPIGLTIAFMVGNILNIIVTVIMSKKFKFICKKCSYLKNKGHNVTE